MAVIDIGSPAVYDASYNGSGYTYINMNNPANDTGKITSVEIYANTILSDCEVATFYLVSGSNYSTRDTHTIGTVPSGSKQTFSGLDISVEAGDFIGIYFSGGRLCKKAAGVGDLYRAGGGDFIPCTEEEFSVNSASSELSLYGTGTTEAPPVAKKKNVIFMGSNF